MRTYEDSAIGGSSGLIGPRVSCDPSLASTPGAGKSTVNSLLVSLIGALLITHCI